MLDRDQRRTFLDDNEARLFDLVFDRATPEQLTQWLRLLLEVAADTGDLNLVSTLQNAGAEGSTMHLAVRGRHVMLVADLLERGASPGERDANGDAPLHLAAVRGDEKMVRVLLSHGADPNQQDSKRRTPLHLAARHGQAGAAEALLSGGAWVSPFCDSDGCSPLQLAVQYGHLNLLAVLAKHGADIDVASSSGVSALHLAASRGMLGVLRSLAEAGADLEARDKDGSTALHVAAEHGASVSIDALLALGASTRKLTRAGFSPLCLAAKEGHIRSTIALLAAGPKSAVDDRQGGGASPLEWAACNGYADVVRALLMHGADVNSASSPDQPALHRAADGGHLDVLTALILSLIHI